ncbi:DUF4232 domain-containing protein [Streptomyces wuyuanensis]|uniref:DUF4232 domain-containing protein n=1 Tax=Streptomyces wuyuanensis TaxID=1196353 RepID=UPI003417F97F
MAAGGGILTLVGGSVVAGAPAAHASRAPAVCAPARLYVSTGAPDVGAGQLRLPVRFTDTAASACTLGGFPQVRVLDAAHHPIGPPARPQPRPHGTVVLRPGATATALVSTTDGPVSGRCLPRGTFLRIVPPGSTRPAVVPAALSVCSNVFGVSPVAAPPPGA